MLECECPYADGCFSVCSGFLLVQWLLGSGKIEYKSVACQAVPSLRRVAVCAGFGLLLRCSALYVWGATGAGHCDLIGDSVCLWPILCSQMPHGSVSLSGLR